MILGWNLTAVQTLELDLEGSDYCRGGRTAAGFA